MVRFLLIVGATCTYTDPAVAPVEEFDHSVARGGAQATADAILASQPELSSPEEDGGCAACVRGGAEWIMKEAAGQAAAECQPILDGSVDCQDEGKKHFCRWWASNEKQAMGFLIQMIRPLGLASAWCQGAKQCPSPKETEALLAAESSTGAAPLEVDPAQFSVALSPETLFGSLDAEHHHHHHCHHHHHRGFFRWLHHLFHPHDDDDDHHKGGICPHCYRATFAHVLEHAIWGIKEVCAKTTDGRTQHFCKWGGEHPDAAYGYIIGMVEPWKYAIGRCYHTGHPHHHHHEKDGGDPHPHHPEHLARPKTEQIPPRLFAPTPEKKVAQPEGAGPNKIEIVRRGDKRPLQVTARAEAAPPAAPVEILASGETSPLRVAVAPEPGIVELQE